MTRRLTSNLKDYLVFQRFMMPYALQVLFWAGIVGVLYGAWWLYTRDHWAWVPALVFGTLVTRLVFESFILKYRTYLCLVDIRDKLRDSLPDFKHQRTDTTG